MAKKVNTVEVEVWVLVDEGGDYAAGQDREGAKDSYDTLIGNDLTEVSHRYVKVKLTVPLPEVAEIVAVVPEQGQVEGVLS